MEFPEIKKKLLLLLADGKFHSGSELAAVLGVSRSAIWKQLNALPELGIDIAAVSGKGYRLERAIDWLDAAEIEQAMTKTSRALLAELEIHQHITSTNSHLMDRARDDVSSGTVCLAEYQTAGRGRRGREWVSPFGSNIYLSILWRFHQGPAVLSGLSLVAGVAAIRALQSLDIKGLGLKWPNDIYWQGKKLGGILVEVAGEANGPCSVVLGIGVNISLSEKEAQNIIQAWTDLQFILNGTAPPRNRLAAALLNELLPVLAGYENHGLQHYLEEWRSYDCMLDRPVTLHLGQNSIEGIVHGINADGMLLLKRKDGRIQVFTSGEVSFNG